jgi:predicted O-methyltransferase YrrM
VDARLEARLDALCAEGWALWERFIEEMGVDRFHPFVAADYEVVRAALTRCRAPGLRFLEWGSATGVITVMADLLGFEAYGIELDPALVATARNLARKFDSQAVFAEASFLPQGYHWRDARGDRRTGTLGSGPSGYLALGHALDEFDVVFGYAWDGEEPVMLDIMKQYGRANTLLLLHSASEGVTAYRDGRPVVLG